MSRERGIQSGSPIQEKDPGYGVTRVVTNAAPSNSTSGYAKGCTWQNLAGSAGTMFYINEGTNTSSTWTALGSGVTFSTLTVTTLTVTTEAVTTSVITTATITTETVTTSTITTANITTLNVTGTSTFTGAVTTTDGVASGTARKVGGTAFVDVSTNDTITAATSANAFVSFAQTYPVPTNTIKAGTMIRVRLFVDVINAAAGTATLTINLRLGGTSLIASTAIDPAQNDWHSIEFVLVGRAAPSATSAIVGVGRWTTSTAGTNVTKEAILQSTNFATNGALTLDCQAKWSAADATTTAQLELMTVEVIG